MARNQRNERTLEFVDDFAGTYWFIWATFVSYLLLKISTKLNHQSWVISGLAILVALAPLTFSISPLIRFTYPFFCFGFLLAQSRERWTSTSRHHKPLLILFLSIVTCVCFLAWDKDTYVYNNLGVIHDFRSAKNVLLMFVGSAAASAIAIELLLQCWSIGRSNRMARFIAVELGQTTLLLYLVRVPCSVSWISYSSETFGISRPGRSSRVCSGQRLLRSR